MLLTEKIGWPNLIFQRHSLTQYVKGCCTTICGQKRFPLIPRFLFLRFSTKEGTLLEEQKGQIVQKLFTTRNILAPHEDSERSLFGAQRDNVGIDFDKCRRETQEVRQNWLAASQH